MLWNTKFPVIARIGQYGLWDATRCRIGGDRGSCMRNLAQPVVFVLDG
jgi:hypothetical protein